MFSRNWVPACDSINEQWKNQYFLWYTLVWNTFAKYVDFTHEIWLGAFEVDVDEVQIQPKIAISCQISGGHWLAGLLGDQPIVLLLCWVN